MKLYHCLGLDFGCKPTLAEDIVRRSKDTTWILSECDPHAGTQEWEERWWTKNSSRSGKGPVDIRLHARGTIPKWGIRNANTRAAYAQAVGQFLNWCQTRRLVAQQVVGTPGGGATSDIDLSGIIP